MLYQIYESQRTLMEPFVDFAQAAAKLYSNSSSPIGKSPFAQRVSAGYSLMYRLGKDYEKPAFDIRAVDADGVSLAIHERVEVDKPFCELRRFKRFTDDLPTLSHLKGQPAVLIVAPLSGHYSTLLRDTVKTMLKDHKVYITDWKNARNVPLSDGAFHLDDYVNYVQEFIRHLQAKYGNCHVISVCQPTVPVFAAISLMASRGETTPLSMIMMGGPIDARLSATAVNNLATTKPYEWFENNVIYRVPSNFPGAGRRVYPGFLQHTGFVAMNPDRHASSHYDYFKNLIKGDDASTEAHRKFYDEYNAVLDMDADYYLETIKTVFQEFKLVNGTWEVMSVDGQLERVKPGDIKTTAVMTVEGELDDISGTGQTRAALEMCSGVPESQKKHLDAIGAGHYGIFSGRRWREVVYPAVKSFILEQNHSLTPAASPALAAPKAIAETANISVPVVAKKPVAKAAPVAKPKAKALAKAAPAVVEKPLAPSVPAAVVKPSAPPAPIAVDPKATQAAAAPAPVAPKATQAAAAPAPVAPKATQAAAPAPVPAAEEAKVLAVATPAVEPAAKDETKKAAAAATTSEKSTV
ncbi:MAG: polyhydroxyalkanoate depolymerase [Pseudomonadota bacterium]|nr:polyhydroxyalkanoate depolymerase [Pseudomonadota bacterium]